MDKLKGFTVALGAGLTPVFDYLYGSGEAVTGIMAALLFFVIMDWIPVFRLLKRTTLTVADMDLIELYGLSLFFCFRLGASYWTKF